MSLTLPRAIRPVLFAVMATALCLSSATVRAQDPVSAFIAGADSAATAGGEDALASWVSSYPLIVGAAVAQLLDVAFRVALDGNDAGEAENVAFAERVAVLHRTATGSVISAELVRVYREWTPEARGERVRAIDLEARAAESRSAGDLSLAESLYNEARGIYEHIGDAHAVAVNWGSLGVTHWYAGDFAQVISDYDSALAARRAVEDRILEGRTLNGLGSAYQQTGDYHTSASYYKQAVELRRATGDVSGLGTSLTYLGNTYYFMRKLDDARKSYEEALPILQTLGQPVQMVEILSSLANLNSDAGDIAAADDAYRRAIAIADENELTEYEALFRLNLADNYYRAARYADATQEIEQVAALMETTPMPRALPQYLLARGLVELATGDVDAARDSFLASKAAAITVQDVEREVHAQVAIGSLYRELGAHDRAIAAFSAARDMAIDAQLARPYRSAIVDLAESQVRVGQHAEALVNFEEALSQDHADGAVLEALEDRLNIAVQKAALGRMEEARAELHQVLADAGESAGGQLRWIAHLGLGETFETNNPDSAAWHYEAAMAAMEGARAELVNESSGGFFSGQRRSFYEQIAVFYARNNRIEDAFVTAERARARRLASRMTAGSAAPITLPELQRSLPRKTLVLAYTLGDSASLAWEITAGHVRTHELPGRNEFRVMVRQMRDAISQPGAGDAAFAVASRALYSHLVEPMNADAINDADHVVIIPDGVLFELPFEALLTSDPGADVEWSQASWFASAAATTYMPSATIYVRLNGRKSTDRYDVDLAAWGAPNYSTLTGSGASLAALPYAERELTAVAERAKPKRREVRTGGDATETALKHCVANNSVRVVHLATHGLVNAAEPERSSVVLARHPDDSDDGYLYAEEVSAQEWHTGLVVLSACETASGRVTRGEGVVGLAQAFFVAGSGGVVASLWPVNDASTATLMDAFYERMLGDRDGAAVAMQTARQSMIRGGEYAHPFYWAPFIVMGANGTPW